MPTRRSRPALPTEPGPFAQDEGGMIDDPIEGDTDEARRQRIAARAYLRAERRGFSPGQELDDWLAAESEESDGDPHDTAR